MGSIFSKIIAGEIPSYKVAEDDAHYAFLDINPLNEGHTLVVPKREVDYILDLSDDEYAAMSLFAKKVARAIEGSVACRRIAQAVIGLEVPHAHIHLIPIESEADVDFRRAKKQFTPEQMARTAAKINAAFEAL